MTDFEREIQVFILTAFKAANGQPMTDAALRGAITTRFQHVAMTAKDVGAHIERAKGNGLISDAEDFVFGAMWALTPLGNIRAKQLR